MGKILPIVTIGEEVLKKACEDVKFFEEVKELCEDMVETLRFSTGVGLAAPQVGVSKNLFVVECKKDDTLPNKPSIPLKFFINPKIVETSEEKEFGFEGCLSIPNLRGKVNRFTKIKLAYLNENWEPEEGWFEGYYARIIQHEYDHLQGITYIERMEDLKELYTLANYQRYIVK